MLQPTSPSCQRVLQRLAEVGPESAPLCEPRALPTIRLGRSLRVTRVDLDAYIEGPPGEPLGELSPRPSANSHPSVIPKCQDVSSAQPPMGRNLAVSTSANGNGKTESVLVAVTYVEAPGRGWVADAPEIRSVASGETQAKALEALKELVQAYPELLDEIRKTKAVRRFEEVAV